MHPKVRAAIAAAGATARAALASEDLRAQRRAICQTCEFLRRGLIETCGKCGCPIASKTLSKSATCPDQRW